MKFASGTLMLSLFLFFVWVALCGFLDGSVLLVGIGLSVGMACLSWKPFFHPVSFGRVRFLSRAVGFLLFVPLVLHAMLKGSAFVASQAFQPKLTLRPGFFVYKTTRVSRGGVVALANVVTLTPGTLTVDIARGKNELLIHTLTLEGRDEAALSQEIFRLERGVARFAE